MKYVSFNRPGSKVISLGKVVNQDAVQIVELVSPTEKAQI